MTDYQVIDAFDMRIIRAVVPQGAPLITVYNDPAEFPGKYVARLFNGRQGTHLVAVADTLAEILKAKPKEMIRVQKHETDSPKVIETWL